jgi:uncharacterized protein (DUF58 family)
VRTLPSSRTVVVCLVAGFALASAAPPGAPALIVIAAAALFLAARADGRRAEGSFALDRDVPARIPQGEWADVTWTVRAGEAGVRALVVTENLSESVESEDLEARFALPAGGIGRARARICPRRRGLIRIGPGAARVLGPRGLGWRRVVAGPAREVRVDPPVEALRRLSLDANRARWQGGRTGRLRGVGSEFEALRDYRRDDDSRWIDWKATARRRKLTSREYQVDEHQSVVFLVDTGRLMAAEDGERSKLDHALGAALAIGHAAMTRGDNLGVLAFDRVVRGELAPARGRGQAVRLHETLSRLEPTLVEPDYAGAFARLRRTVRKRSLVLVFTDLVDESVSAELIRAVAAGRRRHLVIVVTLSDRELVEQLAREPAAPLDAYRSAVAADALLLRDAAVRRLRGSGVVVVDTPADRLAAAAVEAYLRVRMENRV